MNADVPIRLTPARSKAVSNRAHATTRAAERFGLCLTDDDFRDWESRIAHSRPDAVMLSTRHGKRNRTLYAVKHDDQWIPLIYDTATQSVLTVLPAFVLDRYMGTLLPTPPAILPTPVSASTLLAGLPPIPCPSEGAGTEDLDRALLTISERQAELNRRIALGNSRQVNAEYAAEVVRTAAARRELKRKRHKAQSRVYAACQSVPDPTDPLIVLLALYRAQMGMTDRLGPDAMGHDVVVACRAARHCLGVHGLLPPL